MKRISYVGDSYTTPPAYGVESSWTDVAAAAAGLSVVGTYAVPGRDTRAILDELLPQALADRSHVVAMMTGINDWDDGVSRLVFKARVREFANRVRYRGKVPVVIVEPLLGNTSETGPARWAAARGWLREAADALDIVFSDAGDALTGLPDEAGPVVQRRPEFASDGSHFTPRAGLVLGRAAAPALMRAAGVKPPAAVAGVVTRGYWRQVGSAPFTTATVLDDSGLFAGGVATEITYTAGASGGLVVPPIEGVTDYVPAGARVDVALPYRVMASPGHDWPSQIGLTLSVRREPGEFLAMRSNSHYVGDAGVAALEVAQAAAGPMTLLAFMMPDLPDGQVFTLRIGNPTIERAHP